MKLITINFNFVPRKFWPMGSWDYSTRTETIIPAKLGRTLMRVATDKYYKVNGVVLRGDGYTIDEGIATGKWSIE